MPDRLFFYVPDQPTQVNLLQPCGKSRAIDPESGVRLVKALCFPKIAHTIGYQLHAIAVTFTLNYGSAPQKDRFHNNSTKSEWLR